ncbi:VirK family protein [Lonsdalea quercina]|uniref:VirK family protein n=1 Tax=Lonsdalea quercina TaxID=71657 RepID=UPI00047B3F92|nr:VirK family protein [Lonsdalea quercina]
MSRMTPLFLTVSLLTVAASACAARPLTSQSTIINALNQGSEVAVSIDLSQCTPQNGAVASQTRGGLRIQAYRLTGDSTLSFSDEHFTVANDGKPIQQFMRYQVLPDNIVNFTTYMYDLPSLQQRGTTLSYRCNVGQGVSFFAE